MRGAHVIQGVKKGWGRRLMGLFALLAIALHIFTIQGHAHIIALPQHGAVSGALAHDHAILGRGAGQTLSKPSSEAPCMVCQTLASAGAGLIPSATLLGWSGAAALIAALFGPRRISLQRLNTQRSRAPPRTA